MKKVIVPILDCEEHSEYRTAKIILIKRNKEGEYFVRTSLCDVFYISTRGYEKGDSITYKIVKTVVDEVSKTKAILFPR